MNENNLKTFILYCQSVETIYTEWKNYWIKVLTNDTHQYSLEDWKNSINKYNNIFKQ